MTSDGRGPSDSDLDVGILDAVSGKEVLNRERDELLRGYLRALYVMIKHAFVYDSNNATLRNACERVAAVANEIRVHHDAQAAIEFRADGIYVNRTLIKLDAATFDQGEYLLTVWHTLGVAEISAVAETGLEDWLELISVFKECVGPGGDFRDLAKRVFARIRLTPADEDAGYSGGLAVTDRFRALRAYATTIIQLGELIDGARAGRSLRPARLKRSVQEMISLASSNAALLMSLAHMKRHKIALQHHLTNTTVLVICAARALEIPRRQVCELAIQAIFHDIGRAFSAPDERETGPMSEHGVAMQAVRKLVGAGSTSTRTIGRVVVANEVRRWAARDLEPPGDTPYPFELCAGSKLISVARSYSLMTTPTPARPALLPDDALRVIMRDAARRYDASAVRLLVNALGVYPVGSTVSLSDGRVAIVCEAPHAAAGPTQPRLKIVRDSVGNLVDGGLVDLAGDAGARTRIVACVDGEDEQINAPAFLLS